MMNSFPYDPKLDPLFTLARETPLDTSRMEYAFETRLLARLRQRSWLEILPTFFWKTIPAFSVVVLILSLWNLQVAQEADEAQNAAYTSSPDPVLVLNED